MKSIINNAGRFLFIAISAYLMIMAAVIATAAQNGALKVTSFPSGAKVTIDGADTLKVTPMSTSLALGDHTVVVSIPNSGWNPDTRTVTIVSGNNDLSVTLLPILTMGPPGPKGDKGDRGDVGPQGPQGIQGPPGITPAEIAAIQQQISNLQNQVTVLQQQGGGLSDMIAFKNTATDGSTATHSWTVPTGVTRVMVEIWGGGGGGNEFFGGGGGGYIRSILEVTPGTVFTIKIGGGGLSAIPLGRSATDGSDSSMGGAGLPFLFAHGGFAGGVGGSGSFSATIHGRGGDTFGPAGAAAFGASFCPNGELTGKGGDAFSGGHPGYVLLVW